MRALVAALAVATSVPAHAACTMERAVYRDRDLVAELAFAPVGGQAVSNSFTLAVRDGPAMQGHVLWADDPARPYGQLMSDCPEGDVTGEELADCTLWQGVVYAIGGDGVLGLIPGEGKEAPERLLLADLAYQMRWSAAYAKSNMKTLPWDEFRLSGCQE